MNFKILKKFLFNFKLLDKKENIRYTLRAIHKEVIMTLLEKKEYECIEDQINNYIAHSMVTIQSKYIPIIEKELREIAKIEKSMNYSFDYRLSDAITITTLIHGDSQSRTYTIRFRYKISIMTPTGLRKIVEFTVNHFAPYEQATNMFSNLWVHSGMQFARMYNIWCQQNLVGNFIG